MERTYWTARKRTSLANARSATGEARMIHLDLAGRYSIKAANCRINAKLLNEEESE